jgi:hypothetical protein
MTDNNTEMLRVIHKFLTDKDFRCKVLFREYTTLTNDEHLNLVQVGTLLSLNPDAVWAQLRKDLAPAEQAMVERSREIRKIANLTPAAIMQMVTADAMLYGGGEVHLRSIDPATVEAPGQRTFEVRGQGFGPRAGIEIRFEHASGAIAAGSIGPTSCDPDILQRVQVTAALALTGAWTVSGRNAGESWGADVVTILVG